MVKTISNESRKTKVFNKAERTDYANKIRLSFAYVPFGRFKIITVGSDAHVPQNIAAHFERAEAVLKECGFTYYTVFETRTPIFKKL